MFSFCHGFVVLPQLSNDNNYPTNRQTANQTDLWGTGGMHLHGRRLFPLCPVVWWHTSCREQGLCCRCHWEAGLPLLLWCCNESRCPGPGLNESERQRQRQRKSQRERKRESNRNKKDNKIIKIIRWKMDLIIILAMQAFTCHSSECSSFVIQSWLEIIFISDRWLIEHMSQFSHAESRFLHISFESLEQHFALFLLSGKTEINSVSKITQKCHGDIIHTEQHTRRIRGKFSCVSFSRPQQ